jgi:glycerophosphoryl diester phosphodiesterase
MTNVIGHRCGNDLATLRSAVADGVRTVEADVRLYHGRLEVRHVKTVGPIPLYWERRRPVRAPSRLLLRDLVEACDPRTELLLDLKGARRALSHLLLRELRPSLGRRRLAVCARNWRLLAPFAGVEGIAVLWTIRTRRALRAFLAGAAPVDGVSVHADLVDADSVAALRRRAGRVLVFPVETAEQARRLRALGVDGLVTERLELVLPVREAA